MSALQFCPSRFIPAGAGNSQRPLSLVNQHAVYPRWRGELTPTTLQPDQGSGLSPLARGTLPRGRDLKYAARFIPAGAGNSFSYAAHYQIAPVYPRWRGELKSVVEAGKLKSGLSPLARGTRRRSCPRRLAGRFIPAGAGNSCCCCGLRPVQTVYPRWRGELWPDPQMIFCEHGLSPLARGTLSADFFALFAWRFIPAGAGNSP